MHLNKTFMHTDLLLLLYYEPCSWSTNVSPSKYDVLCSLATNVIWYDVTFHLYNIQKYILNIDKLV